VSASDSFWPDVRAAADDRAALRAIAATPDVAWATPEVVPAPVTPTTLEVSTTVDPHDAHDSVTSVRHDEHDHGGVSDRHETADTHDADADVASTDDATDTHDATHDATADASHDATAEPAHDATDAAPDHGDAAHTE